MCWLGADQYQLERRKACLSLVEFHEDVLADDWRKVKKAHQKKVVERKMHSLFFHVHHKGSQLPIIISTGLTKHLFNLGVPEPFSASDFLRYSRTNELSRGVHHSFPTLELNVPSCNSMSLVFTIFIRCPTWLSFTLGISRWSIIPAVTFAWKSLFKSW